MPPTERRFWIVRAGNEGQDEEQVLSSGLAMIGFPEASFPIPDDKNVLQEQLAAAHSDWNSKGHFGQTVGQLFRFAHEISEGDFVVLPKKGAGPIAVGTVTGPYEHREIAGELRHTRTVRWIRNDISRDEFSQNELKFIDPGMTVFRILNNNVTERIGRILDEPPSRLKSDEGLRRACEQAGAKLDPDQVREMAALLKKVQDAPVEERATESFQSDVWTNWSRSVWAGGNYSAHVKSALQDSGFRDWFAQQTARSIATDSRKRTQDLHNIYLETTVKLKQKAGRVPNIETLRTLAVFFPGDFTGVAHEGKLFALLRAMGMSGSEERPVKANRDILDRLDHVIGTLERSDLKKVAERMLLTVELSEPAEDEPVPADTSQKQPERPDYTNTDLGTAPDFGALKRRFEDNTKRLYFPDGLLKTLHCGLWADGRRHFAILSGLSGSGKTQLAIEYAKALTGDYQEDPKRWQVTAVQPGWYDPGSLLGYVNPLDKEKYKSTATCKLLHRASDESNGFDKDLADDPYRKPYVLILDEMNLSHPEQYFAPLLSAMEQNGGPIRFHEGDEPNNGVEHEIDYPANLVIIGTVNMDETTLGISDKVLDRAFTREFWKIKPDKWWSNNKSKLTPSVRKQVKSLLKALHFTLKPALRHFGYRVIAEVNGFLERYQQEETSEAPEGNNPLEDTQTLTDALDTVIYAKVLPKLRGDDAEEFRTCLEDTKKVLEGHRLNKEGKLELPKSSLSETASEDANGREQEVIKLTNCENKVENLLKQLQDTGSATFWR